MSKHRNLVDNSIPINNFTFKINDDMITHKLEQFKFDFDYHGSRIEMIS